MMRGFTRKKRIRSVIINKNGGLGLEDESDFIAKIKPL